MRTSTFPLIDRLLDGKFEALLREWRSTGDSHETIAYRLRSDYGIETTKGTVRRWCIDLGVEDQPAATGTEG